VLRANRAFAIAFVALGVLLLAVTIARGGGQVGVLLAAVYLVLGVLRWRALRQPPGDR
jgi:hypothetical protein